jgi:putative glutamine amidotransferase
MSRPLIGITGRRWPASRLAEFLPWSFHDAEFDFHFTEYPAAVTRAGGIPVELTRDAPIAECLARLDGVIISGGADVDPSAYGAERDVNVTVTEPDRDEFELAVIAEALRTDLPLLGICRGAQLLQVHLGGELNQHVTLDDGDGHPRFDTSRHGRCHAVRFSADTLAHRLYGDEVAVNSLHHQTIATPARGLVVSGVSPDGTVEAIEIANHPVLAVQWHPESLIDSVDPSLTWLVETATTFLLQGRSS